MRGETGAHRDACVTCEEGYRAIRTVAHKYLETTNDEAELYDLTADPDEQHNVLAEQPDIAGALRNALRRRLHGSLWPV